ncbi:hypothetical protein GGTG_06638 [Gaeumannomyces tritici R3-111a-1]|uniref:Uncharacterized protein n=1 Tax=Gaeumannomyces tritici (strain R3-111a-1) TaxID=644352 RepID=J3NZD9_GAET3|nr:hypothetical protein GGTG_06638 [Gaeumannomyces tritici R3-111a-1]EJT76722.1 hypothetical protein GGTG_06638 [Gaeumannomyces tritici R3-111a-1]
MGDRLGSGSGQAVPDGLPQLSVWGIDMREEANEPQATETDNHLIGYLAMAEMISQSGLCEYCQTTLAKHLINEDTAIRRPIHSGGLYEPNRHGSEHWTAGTSIATFLGPHVVDTPPRSHLPTTPHSQASRKDRWAARNLACFRRRWLNDPAWRQRRLRGWLSRLCRPLTFRPAPPAEGVPAAAGHNVWELKLWHACAGRYDLVDLAQGRDVREWARLARMHLVTCESAELGGGRCLCKDVDHRPVQDPARLAWYQGHISLDRRVCYVSGGGLCWSRWHVPI